MIIKLIYFLFLALFSGESSAVMTVQTPELLLHNTDTLYIHVEYKEDSPLYNLFLLEDYNTKLEAQIDTSCWSSGCSREYAPLWKIENNEFYLNKLKHCCSGKEVDLNKVFNRKNISKEGVKAFWVNEKISVSNKFAELYYFYFDIDEYDKINWYKIKIKEGIVKRIKEEKRN